MIAPPRGRVVSSSPRRVAASVRLGNDVPASLAALPWWLPFGLKGDPKAPGIEQNVSGRIMQAGRNGGPFPAGTLDTLQAAIEVARYKGGEGAHRGVGVAPLPDPVRRLVAIDLDAATLEDGTVHAAVAPILARLHTWVERSFTATLRADDRDPAKRDGPFGLHAFGWVDATALDTAPPGAIGEQPIAGDPAPGWPDGAPTPRIGVKVGQAWGVVRVTGEGFGEWARLDLADLTPIWPWFRDLVWGAPAPPPSRAVQGQETRDTGTSVGARPYLTWPTAQALAEALGATATGSGQWHGRCPAHDGTTDRNLHITERPGRPPLVHCFGGGRCSQAAVVDALVARGIVTMSADGGWPLTDAGNATRLVAAHGDDLRWDAPRTRWLAWDGRRWHPVPGEGVAQRARRLVEDATGPAAQAARAEREATGRRGPAARWHGHLLASQGRARIEAAVAIARGDPAVLLDDTARLDDDAGTLVVGDGVVDLRTGEVRPHRRDDLGTRVVLHGDKPAPYVPDAPAPEAWAAYVERAVPDPTVRAWLWVILGAGIVGDGSARRLLVLHGPPASGKGTMVATVLAALGGDDGGYVTTGDPDVLMVSGRDGDGSGHLAGVARWRDRRLVALDETGDGRKVDPGRLKRLLPGAGGAIYARDLYERGSSSRAMAPTWLPILTTNHLPAVGGGDDEAVWDRVAVVPFDRRVEPEERTDLSSRLPRDPAVLAHVLACIVDGARRYLADPRLLAHPPIAVRAAVEAWRGQGDSRARAGDLDGWLRSGGVEVGPNLEAKWVDLRASYDAWCDARRVFAPLTNGAMATALADLPGVKQRRTRTSRVWVGIGLVGDLDDLEGEADGLA